MSVQEEEHLEASDITDSSVADYLRDHPDFFNKHTDIVTKLMIPHERGEAISLVERQVEALRQQNQQIRERLHKLIEIARQNQELAHRMHQLLLVLIDAKRPRDIFRTLYDNLERNFHADYVVVRLFASPAFIDDAPGEEFVGKIILKQSMFKHIIEKRLPFSGNMADQQQVFLFGDNRHDIASSVIIPLHGKDWAGILAIGSVDAKRFQPNMGVELLANLGEVLSLILKPWVAEE